MFVLHGETISPQTRKVILALNYKGLEFELSPTSPFDAQERLLHRPPVDKIATLEHDGCNICSSAVIAHYLDDMQPNPMLYPGNAKQRASTRWLEAFSDSHLSELLVDCLFYQHVVRAKLLDKPIEEEKVELCLRHQLPLALNYLSKHLPNSASRVLTMADISLWSVFRSGTMAGLQLSESYPALQAYLDTLSQHPVIADYSIKEDHQLSGFYCDPFVL